MHTPVLTEQTPQLGVIDEQFLQVLVPSLYWADGHVIIAAQELPLTKACCVGVSVQAHDHVAWVNVNVGKQTVHAAYAPVLGEHRVQFCGQL